MGKKAGPIISLIALAIFLFTLPFQIYLGLSFSAQQYQFWEPVFKMLTIPLRWIIQSGILKGSNAETSKVLAAILFLLNAFLYAILIYAVGRLVLGTTRNPGPKRNQKRDRV